GPGGWSAPAPRRRRGPRSSPTSSAAACAGGSPSTSAPSGPTTTSRGPGPRGTCSTASSPGSRRASPRWMQLRKRRPSRPRASRAAEESIVTRARRFIASLGFLSAAALAAPVPQGGGEFSATATVNTSQGTRSLAFNLVVTNPMTMEQAQPFREVLARGGQQMLLKVIRGEARGRVRLGALEFPVELVVAEPDGDDVRYYVVTTRQLQYDEVTYNEESLDYPFSLLVVTVPEIGTGDGTIFTKAALYVDDEGHVRAEQYQGEPGSLKDVKRLK